VTEPAPERDSRSVEARVIWLFGSPRSGSTWLRHMAAAHPGIVAMDEPTIGYHLGPFLSNEPGYHAADLDLGTFTLRRVVEDNPERFFAAKYADVWLPSLRRLLNDRLLAHLEREVGGTAPDDALLLVKEPNGSQSADVIMRAQPDARLLFLLRDGRDVVDSELASFLVGAWQERLFAHMRGVAQAERLDFVTNSAYQWLWRTEVVEAAFAEHRGPRHMLRYEDLLREPVRHLSELFEWLGQPLGPTEVAAIVDRFAFERQKWRGPTAFNRSATPGAWRENLRSEERAAVEEILGVKLRELGYD
jgi:LPS sulfotransferase NodH